jgi:DNA-binding transcriptional LysR family regulator
MNISTEHIEAFLEVSKRLSFSQAAKTLGLTQAALSIRIKKLEDQLERSLFTRSRSGIVLTEAGEKFMVYAQTFESLQSELAQEFKSGDHELSGDIKIGTFSTIGRSLVLPAITKLLIKHPKVSLNYMVKETHELYPMLKSSEVDFIFLDHLVQYDGIEQILIGHEEYVMIESKLGTKVEEIFLNHDEKDMTTFEYFNFLGKPKKQLKRRYLDEIYSVIDAVAAGFGRSVLPLNLIETDKRIKILNPEKKMKRPVYLTFKKRPYYTALFKQTQWALLEALKKILSIKP